MKNNVKKIQKALETALTGLSWSLDLRRSGTELYDGKPDGSWNRTAEKMLMNFEGSGHPISRCTSALERGQLRSKEGGKTNVHFTASDEKCSVAPKKWSCP